MKRLSGWDAVLLYSETPTVHMHTLKLAVIELEDLGGRTFGIDEFLFYYPSRTEFAHGYVEHIAREVMPALRRDEG